MPYIKKERRKKYDKLLDELIWRLTEDLEDGDTTYVINYLVKGAYPAVSYKILNRAIGVLECVKQEFYRRRIAPYEDKKKEENGDVF